MKKKFLYIFLTILLCLTMVLPFMANAFEKPLAITASAKTVGFPRWDLNQTDYVFYEYENKGTDNYDFGIIYLDNIPSGYISFYIYTLDESQFLRSTSLNYDWDTRFYFNESDYGDNVFYISKENVPGGSFLIVEPFYKNINCRFVIKFDNHEYNPLYLTGSYMEGFLDGVKYDQTQAVEGSASWNAGFNHFAEVNTNGVFLGAKLDLEFSYDNHSTIILNNIDPVIKYGYLTYPDYLWQNYIEGYYSQGYDPDGVEVTITLKDSVQYGVADFMRFGDDTAIMGAWFVDDNGNTVFANNDTVYRDTALYPMVVEKYNLPQNNFSIKKIVLYYGRAYDTFRGAGVADFNTNYSQGYAVGVNDGIEVGKSEGFSEGLIKGKEIGRIEGEEIGYEKAVLNGVSANGIFNSTIAIITTCFTLAGTFLGTKIAGDLTIGLFVIGLPATFMIIDLIISLVKNLLSAGGSKGGDD